ncbi:MAG: hypothetical protein CL819_01295 [Croceicoccus sp.]|nr:hypothetical protein [Croceicoccus sp.]
MAGSLGSILPSLGFLDPIVQDNTLVREFRDALFPQLLYRDEAAPEKWEVNVGDVQVFTRASLIAPNVTALTPGADPTPKAPAFEQWRVQAEQFGDAMDTHMPSSRTALAPIFARNAKTLGLQAGQSLNRLARNRLFCRYVGGDTITANAGAPSATVVVGMIDGFTTTIVNGEETPVSAANPKTARISGVAGTVSIIAAVPADPNNPFGPGTLTLSAAATFAVGSRVLASDAPRIIRVGGAGTIDGLTAISSISLKEIRQAIATMRRNRVPTHPDGYYHVHLDPIAESQIYNDNEFQRLNQGVPDGLRYAEFAIGRLLGAIFFSNNESPNVFNSAETGESGLIASRAGTSAVASPEYYGEVRNASGVGIVRTLITGGGAIMEKYIDENSDYMSEAGYTGKVGMFNVVNNGIQINVDRVRYIIRSPQDRLQQQVSQAWSWSGDWGVPTDLLGGQLGGRYKRAIVIESGSAD